MGSYPPPLLQYWYVMETQRPRKLRRVKPNDIEYFHTTSRPNPNDLIQSGSDEGQKASALSRFFSSCVSEIEHNGGVCSSETFFFKTAASLVTDS